MAGEKDMRDGAAVSPSNVPGPGLGGAASSPKNAVHPSRPKHGRTMAIARGVAFAVYFISCVFAIITAQLLGAWLYFVDKPTYYAYMAKTKEAFGLTITTMTYWWGSTTIRISGEADVADQMRILPDGRVETDFPDRLVLIANHQIYTDWLYLWWVGYTNRRRMHGNIYIILKESLKWLPLIGQGMMFYGFIFMSRKMAVDQPRLAHRLNKLKSQEQSPVGQAGLKKGSRTSSPMWLLLFPEGTNITANGREKSAKWAQKINVKDTEHVMLPRSTGMYFCLSELKDTVEWVYDCTVAYEGIPRGKYGEDYFTLSSTYFQGRPPKSVNFYWRRFRVSEIPLASASEFDAWMRERWYEKDALMEQYLTTGRFPPNPNSDKFIETEVRTQYTGEFLQMFLVPGLAWVAYRFVTVAIGEVFGRVASLIS